MGRSSSLLVSLMAMAAMMVMAMRADDVNKSSEGEYWSSAKEDESVDHDDFDGGFSSLDGMLQWAIGFCLLSVAFKYYQHHFFFFFVWKICLFLIHINSQSQCEDTR